MANTAISDLGTHVCMSAGDESTEPALGNGSVKAGMAVGILTATGKVVAVDADSNTDGITFIGFVMRHWDIALDTAITDGLALSIAKPISGRKYRVFIKDPGAAKGAGTPLTWDITTGGSLQVVTTEGSTGILGRTLAIDDTVDVPEQPIIAYLNKSVANGDTVAEIVWP